MISVSRMELRRKIESQLLEDHACASVDESREHAGTEKSIQYLSVEIL